MDVDKMTPNSTGTASQLVIEYSLNERRGKRTVTARLDGQPIHIDEVALTKDVERAQFVARLCEACPGVDVAAATAELIRIADDVAGKTIEASADSPDEPSQEELLAQMPETARAEAELFLSDPLLMRRVIEDVGSLGVAGEHELVATIYLIGVSRVLDRPLAAILQGHTASGKSYIPEREAKLFPPETLLLATQQTPQSLFYLRPGALKHRFIIGGERSRAQNDDTAEATRALREMLSAGRLSKLVVMKVNGQMETKLIEQDGPIAYIEGTTATTIFEEDLNRCLLLATDERREQTRRIVEKVAAHYSGQTRHGNTERIILRHHAAQRMLQRRPVVIPYAECLAALFGSDRVEARRAFPQLLSMIQASAVLHQRQRQIDSDGRIIATPDDYQLSHHLLSRPFARQLGGGLSDGAIRFFDRLASSMETREFTTTEAHEIVKQEFCRRAVTGWMGELCDAGAADQLEPHKGNKPARWRLTGTRPEGSAGGFAGMPKPNVLFSELPFPHSDTA